MPYQRPAAALPMLQTAISTPAVLSAAVPSCCLVKAAMATGDAPKEKAIPAAHSSRAGNPGARSGPSPRVRAWVPFGCSPRMAVPRATTTVPRPVQSAAAISAAAGPVTPAALWKTPPKGPATSMKPDSRSGPTTKTTSKSVDSAAMAAVRASSRPLPGPVSLAQEARSAGETEGKAAPESRAAAHSTGSGARISTAVSSASWVAA